MIEIFDLFSQTRRDLSEKPNIIRFGSVEPEVGGLLDLSLFTDVTSLNSDLMSLIEL